MSFLEKHEHGSDLYNQLHPEGNMSPKLPSFDCSPLENSLPVTPPNQKIPAETSPCKLASPNSSNILRFKAINTGELCTSSSDPASINRQPLVNKLRFKKNK